MNERIKELAEQTGYIPLPGFDFANSLQAVFIKKFAYMIVEECAKVCDHIHNENPREDVSASWCANEVRKHFGLTK